MQDIDVGTISSFLQANTTLYDFRNHLKTGSVTLSMWNFTDMDDSEMLNPLGTVLPNPSSVEQTTFLTITFTDYAASGSTIISYPTVAMMKEELTRTESSHRRSEAAATEEKPGRHASKSYIEQIKVSLSIMGAYVIAN